MVVSETNTREYYRMIANMLNIVMCKREHDSHNIAYEIIGAQLTFTNDGIIDGSSKNYIENELNWYKSQDLCIKGHAGIEDNPVWQSCATKLGLVNSNYGWCILSEQNCNQFEEACRSLARDIDTKQAIMVYTRPNIHAECADNIHAHYDMICTCYTNTVIRDDKLIHLVHMRSNDIWYGLRNDLAWQQEVQRMVLERIREYSYSKFKDVKLGKIIWNADSLHLYARNVKKAAEECRKHGWLVPDNL